MKQSNLDSINSRGEGMQSPNPPNPPNYDRWQDESVKVWKENGYRGIVDAVTAAGKTYMIFKAIRMLESDSRGMQSPLFVSIVVPKSNLMRQWKEDMISYGFDEKEIGMYGDGEKNIRRITIYVINSGRVKLPIMVSEGFFADKKHFLAIDEVHRAGSRENRKVLVEADFRIGVSATSKREKDFATEKILIPRIGPVIKEYGFGEAKRDGIIADFMIVNYGVDLLTAERSSYDRYTKKMATIHPVLMKKYPRLKGAYFFAGLQSLIKNNVTHPCHPFVYEYLECARERKDLVYMARNRRNLVLELLHKYDGKKILLSHERVDWLEKLKLVIEKDFSVGIYVGKMKKKEKIQVMEDFKSGKITVLMYAKALGEGTNVPDIDVGILASSTSSLIQRIQGIGRIIRRDGDRKAMIYTIFAKDTTDVAIINKSIKSKKIPSENLETRDWESDSIISLGTKARSPLYDSNPQWGRKYCGKYIGVDLSIDTRCKIFKRGKGGTRLYSQTSDWGIGSKVMAVKRTGGKFKINPIGQILTVIKGRGVIYCGSTDKASDLENGEFKDESIHSGKRITWDELFGEENEKG